MGGRGSGSSRSGGKPKSRFGDPNNIKALKNKSLKKEKINAPTLKTAKDIVPWVKYQVDVDLDKYRTKTTKSFENRNRIVIDSDSMPRTESRKLALLEQAKYNNSIELTPLNHWMYEIRVKKRK